MHACIVANVKVKQGEHNKTSEWVGHDLEGSRPLNYEQNSTPSFTPFLSYEWTMNAQVQGTMGISTTLSPSLITPSHNYLQLAWSNNER